MYTPLAYEYDGLIGCIAVNLRDQGFSKEELEAIKHQAERTVKACGKQLKKVVR